MFFMAHEVRQKKMLDYTKIYAFLCSFDINDLLA